MQKHKLQRSENPKKKEGGAHTAVKIAIAAVVLVIICLCCRSCRARDEPTVLPTQERTYETDVERTYEDVIPTEENKRLSIGISDSYRITDVHPIFYLGYPEENIYDVVFTLYDMSGKELYKTAYIAPGTNVAIDGTKFLEKGESQLECLVSIYNHETGILVSDCTTVVLNMNYE